MKIGIFGGSYNPIHTGHAIIANYIAQNCDFDAIWMLVSPQNPLKDGTKGASDYDRIRMVEMVSRRIDKVSTSAFEFTLNAPYYTYNTLCALSQKFPEHEFTLIIGADNWANFHRWEKHEQIAEQYQIMVYPRRGYEVEIPEHQRRNVHLVDAPMIELSSTEIRDAVAEQKNMSFYLPADVYQYILEHKLYM